ncbi:MAG TPA: hypothetical protein PKX04_00750 [Chitinophagales bacterium]|nr:hypothetical protein [Chitinophagales bacterium]
MKNFHASAITGWLLLLTAFGCGNRNQSPAGEPLARVYDQYLYAEDIKGLTGEDTSPEDSAAIVREYIDNWVRHQLVLRVAESNLPQQLEDIEKQAEDYKESLLIYAYERRWLAENLDTLIAEDTLKSYFDRNRKDFTLKSDIYRLSYAVMPVAVSGYDTLRNWFVKDISKYRNELESFSLTHCTNYVYESQTWLDEASLFRLLPLSLYENGRLRTNQVVEMADENNRYLVKVHEYVVGGNPAPFDYVREDIRRILINKQKLDVLKSNYARMYEDAMQRNNAEIY